MEKIMRIKREKPTHACWKATEKGWEDRKNEKIVSNKPDIKVQWDKRKRSWLLLQEGIVAAVAGLATPQR